MILIISQIDDGPTVHVIKWLKYYNVNYIRINREDTVYLEKMEINDFGDIDIDIRLNKDKIIKLIKLKPYGID